MKAINFILVGIFASLLFLWGLLILNWACDCDIFYAHLKPEGLGLIWLQGFFVGIGSVAFWYSLEYKKVNL